MFEFDPEKSRQNKLKHGINFYEAQALWHDEARLVIPAKSSEEFREAIIACINEVFWTGIYTIRNSNIRIISVRRSRDEEIQLYYHSKGV